MALLVMPQGISISNTCPALSLSKPSKPGKESLGDAPHFLGHASKDSFVAAATSPLPFFPADFPFSSFTIFALELVFDSSRASGTTGTFDFFRL
jgi:hypothetical protein